MHCKNLMDMYKKQPTLLWPLETVLLFCFCHFSVIKMSEYIRHRLYPKEKVRALQLHGLNFNKVITLQHLKMLRMTASVVQVLIDWRLLSREEQPKVQTSQTPSAGLWKKKGWVLATHPGFIQSVRVAILRGGVFAGRPSLGVAMMARLILSM